MALGNSQSMTSIAYLTTLLTTPLSTRISPGKLTTLQSTLFATFSAAASSASDWELNIVIVPQSVLPPRHLLAPCLAAGIQWRTWRDALCLGGERVAFIMDDSRVAVLLHEKKWCMDLWETPSRIPASAELANDMGLTEDIDDPRTARPIHSPTPTSSSSTSSDSDSFWSSASTSSSISVPPSPTKLLSQLLPNQRSKFAWPPVRSSDQIQAVEYDYDGGSARVLSGGVILSANPKNGFPRKKPVDAKPMEASGQ